MSRLSRIRLYRGGDTVAPILSDPTSAQVDDTTATGTVVVATTSAYKEGDTLYFYTTTSTFETRADIIASGQTKAITEDGIQTVTPTGLTASQAYYIHYAYTDFIGTKSNVVVSATFSTTAGGGGGAISGTCAIAFSDAADLTGTGALAGTSSITFSDAADLTGVGALAGTSAITFSTVGDLTGIGTLAGTSAIAFTDAAALIGTGALSGTSAIIFTEAAALIGTGALSGTSQIIFSEAADLTPVGGGAIDGTCAITFSDAADLTGVGALAGTSAITFSDAAALTGTGALAGTSAIAWSSSVALIGTGALAGTTSITFSAAADLTQDPAIYGTCAIAFTSAADLTGAGALAGTCTITWGSAADLTPESVILGGVYNAIEYFGTGASVTIAVFDPVTGDAIPVDDATVNESPSTGRFIWNAANITTQPTVYQEYGYVMTDGTTPKGGVIRMNINATALVQLAAIFKRLDLDTTDQNAYADDGSEIINAEFTLTKADNGDGTFTVTRTAT